ncbi:hypothetical protein [Marivirga sp.]|uniref:hypothetical protein n=1 Tax=Marivirga sp. TaxID=2018662 RepID=UPI0025E1757A|nr:hypothetical protein [Marivirga sp.]
MKSLLLKVLFVGLTLVFNVQLVKSECKIEAVGPLPEMDCKTIWCQTTYSYSGCGSGNGTVCNDEKSCPKEKQTIG